MQYILSWIDIPSKWSSVCPSSLCNWHLHYRSVCFKRNPFCKRLQRKRRSKVFNECMQQNERKDFHRRPKAVGFPIKILVKDGKKKLKKWLSEPVCRIIPALINTPLDYWNSLYVGTSQPLLHRLQLGQNAAARLLTGKWKHDHITLIPASLHSLPVHFRIDFKFSCLFLKLSVGWHPII